MYSKYKTARGENCRHKQLRNIHHTGGCYCMEGGVVRHRHYKVPLNKQSMQTPLILKPGSALRTLL